MWDSFLGVVNGAIKIEVKLCGKGGKNRTTKIDSNYLPENENAKLISTEKWNEKDVDSESDLLYDR